MKKSITTTTFDEREATHDRLLDTYTIAVGVGLDDAVLDQIQLDLFRTHSILHRSVKSSSVKSRSSAPLPLS